MSDTEWLYCAVPGEYLPLFQRPLRAFLSGCFVSKHSVNTLRQYIQATTLGGTPALTMYLMSLRAGYYIETVKYTIIPQLTRMNLKCHGSFNLLLNRVKLEN